MADLFERAAALDEHEGTPRPKRNVAAAPSLEELRAIPYSGDGPDPLEEMWEAS